MDVSERESEGLIRLKWQTMGKKGLPACFTLNGILIFQLPLAWVEIRNSALVYNHQCFLTYLVRSVSQANLLDLCCIFVAFWTRVTHQFTLQLSESDCIIIQFNISMRKLIKPSAARRFFAASALLGATGLADDCILSLSFPGNTYYYEYTTSSTPEQRAFQPVTVTDDIMPCVDSTITECEVTGYDPEGGAVFDYNAVTFFASMYGDLAGCLNSEENSTSECITFVVMNAIYTNAQPGCSTYLPAYSADYHGFSVRIMQCSATFLQSDCFEYYINLSNTDVVTALSEASTAYADATTASGPAPTYYSDSNSYQGRVDIATNSITSDYQGPLTDGATTIAGYLTEAKTARDAAIVSKSNAETAYNDVVAKATDAASKSTAAQNASDATQALANASDSLKSQAASAAGDAATASSAAAAAETEATTQKSLAVTEAATAETSYSSVQAKSTSQDALRDACNAVADPALLIPGTIDLLGIEAAQNGYSTFMNQVQSACTAAQAAGTLGSTILVESQTCVTAKDGVVQQVGLLSAAHGQMEGFALDAESAKDTCYAKYLESQGADNVNQAQHALADAQTAETEAEAAYQVVSAQLTITTNSLADAEAAKTNAETYYDQAADEQCAYDAGQAQIAATEAASSVALALIAKNSAVPLSTEAQNALSDAQANLDTANTAVSQALTAKTAAEASKTNAETAFSEAQTQATTAYNHYLDAQAASASTSALQFASQSLKDQAISAASAALAAYNLAQAAKNSALIHKTTATTQASAAATAYGTAQAQASLAEVERDAASVAAGTASNQSTAAATAYTEALSAQSTADQAVIDIVPSEGLSNAEKVTHCAAERTKAVDAQTLAATKLSEAQTALNAVQVAHDTAVGNESQSKADAASLARDQAIAAETAAEAAHQDTLTDQDIATAQASIASDEKTTALSVLSQAQTSHNDSVALIQSYENYDAPQLEDLPQSLVFQVQVDSQESIAMGSVQSNVDGDQITVELRDSEGLLIEKGCPSCPVAWDLEGKRLTLLIEPDSGIFSRNPYVVQEEVLSEVPGLQTIQQKVSQIYMLGLLSAQSGLQTTYVLRVNILRTVEREIALVELEESATGDGSMEVDLVEELSEEVLADEQLESLEEASVGAGAGADTDAGVDADAGADAGVDTDAGVDADLDVDGGVESEEADIVIEGDTIYIYENASEEQTQEALASLMGIEDPEAAVASTQRIVTEAEPMDYYALLSDLGIIEDLGFSEEAAAKVPEFQLKQKMREDFAVPEIRDLGQTGEAVIAISSQIKVSSASDIVNSLSDSTSDTVRRLMQRELQELENQGNGQVTIETEQELKVFTSLLKLSESVLAELVPGDPNDPDMDKKVFTWDVYQYESDQIGIRFNFTYPEYISSGLEPDRFRLTFMNTAAFLEPRDESKSPVPDGIVLLVTIPPQGKGLMSSEEVAALKSQGQAVVATNFVISIFFKGLMGMIIGSIIVVQIMAHFPLANVSLPANALQNFDIMIGVVSFDYFQPTEYIDFGFSEMEPWSDNFDWLGYGSLNFAESMGSILVFGLFQVFYAIVTLCMVGNKCTCPRNKCATTFQTKSMLQSSLLFLHGTFFEIQVAMAISFRMFEFKHYLNGADFVSLGLSIFFGLVLFVYVLAIFYFSFALSGQLAAKTRLEQAKEGAATGLNQKARRSVMRRQLSKRSTSFMEEDITAFFKKQDSLAEKQQQKASQVDERKFEVFEPLFGDLREDSHTASLINVLIIVRRLSLLFMAMFAGDQVWLHLLVFIVLNLASLTFVVASRPFKASINNRINAVNETVALMVGYWILACNDHKYSVQTKLLIGNFISYTLYFAWSVNALIFASQGLSELYAKVKLKYYSTWRWKYSWLRPSPKHLDELVKRQRHRDGRRHGKSLGLTIKEPELKPPQLEPVPEEPHEEELLKAEDVSARSNSSVANLVQEKKEEPPKPVEVVEDDPFFFDPESVPRKRWQPKPSPPSKHRSTLIQEASELEGDETRGENIPIRRPRGPLRSERHSTSPIKHATSKKVVETAEIMTYLKRIDAQKASDAVIDALILSCETQEFNDSVRGVSYNTYGGASSLSMADKSGRPRAFRLDVQKSVLTQMPPASVLAVSSGPAEVASSILSRHMSLREPDSSDEDRSSPVSKPAPSFSTIKPKKSKKKRVGRYSKGAKKAGVQKD